MPNKLYEIVVTSRYADQLVVNRWNYNRITDPAVVSGSFALASAFGAVVTNELELVDTTVFGKLCLGIWNTGYELVQTLVRSVYDVVDFYDNPYLAGFTGQVAAADPAAPILAYGVRSSRTRSDIGRGQKRFAGAAEDFIGDYGVLDAPILTELTELCTLMGATITFDDDGTDVNFVPVIVKKEMYTEPPAKKAYRYYETELLQQAQLATGIVWSPYDRIRSQTSRQVGHGA